jgi:hypothetical protein
MILTTGRYAPILIVLYAALAPVWVVGEWWIEPDLARVEAGLLALGLSLAYALMLGRWDDRHTEARPPEDRARVRAVSVVLLVVASAFLAVAVLTGAVHDYALYLRFWPRVRHGGDPWYVEGGFWGNTAPNAYGPLFNLLAGLEGINPLAPKLLFAAAYIAAATALTKGLAARRRASWLAALGLLAWAWNPYAWVEVAIRGHFDVLVGLACVAAVHARRRGRDLSCASALAAGVLLKYLPIVLLPFLALDRGRVRVRLVAAAAALIALGMGLSWLVWGPSTFEPVRFAATRSSTYLSIFRFLRGQFSPLPGLGFQAGLDRLALSALALALLGAWWWCRARRADPATAAVLAALVTLLLYRNGFPQYQMVLLMLASYWVAQAWGQRRHRTALAIALVGYFGWIAAFDVAYSLIGDGWTAFEDAVGLPTFALGCALGACLALSEPEPADG